MLIRLTVVTMCIHIYIYDIYNHCCMCVWVLSCFSNVWLFATLWTVAHPALLSMGFSRLEYWSGLPCPPPGDLPDLGIEPVYLMSLELAGRYFTTSSTWESPLYCAPKTNTILFIYIKKFSNTENVSRSRKMFPPPQYFWKVDQTLERRQKSRELCCSHPGDTICQLQIGTCHLPPLHGK